MDSIARLLDHLSRVSIARAATEAAEWSTMLSTADVLAGEADRLDGARTRELAHAMIAMEISIATGWSESQVQNRLAAARRLRDRGPASWLAFQAGIIDAARATAISGALAKLHHQESWAELDQSVIAYASGHTTTEVRAWLVRAVARLEPGEAERRAENQRADRFVGVSHDEDSMAWVSAYVPSIAAAAVDRRLTSHAKAMTGDGRSLDQRRADLFASWLTNGGTDDETAGSASPSSGDATPGGGGADIAVVVPAGVLAGVEPGMAVSQEGTWTTPVGWLVDHIDPEHTFWHRLLTDEAGRILDHTYVNRPGSAGGRC